MLAPVIKGKNLGANKMNTLLHTINRRDKIKFKKNGGINVWIR